MCNIPTLLPKGKKQLILGYGWLFPVLLKSIKLHTRWQGFPYWWRWGESPHQPITSYSLYTQVKPILILINVQYLQNVVFGLEKGSNSQNQFSSKQNSPSPSTEGGPPPPYFENPGQRHAGTCIESWF